MDPLVFFLLAGGGAALSLYAAVSRSRERADSWRAAATEAGLTDITLSTIVGFVSGLSGRVDSLEVRLETYHQGKKEKGTRVTISGLNHHGQLAFRPESLGTRIGKSIGRTEIELGDRDFDDMVYLQGSPELACAIFDAQTRRQVLRLLEGLVDRPGHPHTVDFDGIVVLDNDELRLEMKDPRWGCPPALPLVLPALIATAQRLVRPSDMAGRLVHHIQEDPLVKVRLTNLRVLLESHPQHRRTRQALMDLRGDPNEEIRLRAALELGEPGRPVLIEIASSRDSDDAHAAAAVAGLGEQLPEERAEAILVQSLEARRGATALACVEALGQRRGPRVVRLLARVLLAKDGTLAAAAARALAGTGEAAAEAPLIEALAGDSPEVLEAVAQALQRLGTAAAVMPLREASERVSDGALRRAARQAVATIQSRLQGASPGQLSLAAGERGHAGGRHAGARVPARELPWTG